MLGLAAAKLLEEGSCKVCRNVYPLTPTMLWDTTLLLYRIISHQHLNFQPFLQLLPAPPYLAV